MFGIKYLKTTPTQYAIHYQNGKLRHKGAGIAFFYYQPRSTISIVPLSSADAPFIFEVTTQDYQSVSVQGQLTYRIHEPEKTAQVFDFSMDESSKHYVTEDPDKLPQRLINLIQVLVRSEIQKLPLQTAIQTPEDVRQRVLKHVITDPLLELLGVEVLTLLIMAIKPTPETARALEAEAREKILKQADEAIYDRRNAAVAQERRIKENELNTELAIVAKNRQIREAKVESDLAIEQRRQAIQEMKLAGQVKLEQERKALIDARATNARAEADIEAYAIERSLKPLQALDDKIIQLLSMQSAEPRKMLTLAFQRLAENAEKIGTLNISPELLESLMQGK